MKSRSQHPPPPRAASRPLAGGGGRAGGRSNDGSDSQLDSGLDSEWPSGFVDTGSSFGNPDPSREVGLWGRPRRTAAGPVESWHDSSYVLRRGLEVRELSAREWNVCISERAAVPTPGSVPRRHGDAEGDA